MGDESKSTETLKINQKIMVWAKGKIGKQVGRGECWDLAEQALKQAGAQTSNDLGPVGDDTDYVWGDTVMNIKDVKRGDILQIRDHKVVTTTVVVTTFEDGSSTTVTKTATAKRGHHTAIARSVPDANGTIKTYEQHVNGRDVVQKMSLPTASLPEKVTNSVGKVKHPATKKLETAKISTTVTVEVSGTIWPYRPKAK